MTQGQKTIYSVLTEEYFHEDGCPNDECACSFENMYSRKSTAEAAVTAACARLGMESAHEWEVTLSVKRSGSKRHVVLARISDAD